MSAPLAPVSWALMGSPPLATPGVPAWLTRRDASTRPAPWPGSGALPPSLAVLLVSSHLTASLVHSGCFSKASAAHTPTAKLSVVSSVPP